MLTMFFVTTFKLKNKNKINSVFNIHVLIHTFYILVVYYILLDICSLLHKISSFHDNIFQFSPFSKENKISSSFLNGMEKEQ